VEIMAKGGNSNGRGNKSVESANLDSPVFALNQGTNGDDALIVGTDGNDTIATGSGNDLIIAGLGADTGFFDWEVQTWRLNSAADSPTGAGDTLINFNWGGVLDIIDMAALGITFDDLTISGADENWMIVGPGVEMTIIGAQPVFDNFVF